MAAGGSSIPARGRLGSAGKGRGSGVGSPRVPFRGLLAAEEQPTMVLHGVARCQPQERLFWQGGGTTVAEGGWVSFGGDQGRCGAAWAGVERCTGRSSAVAAAMASDGELWEAGTTAHTWLAQGPKIGGCRLLRDEGNDGISAVVRRQPWWARTYREGTDGRTGGQRRARTGGEGEAPRGMRGLQGPQSAPSLWKKQPRDGARRPRRRGTLARWSVGDVAACLIFFGLALFE
jgi:hypothetical protein